MFGGIDRRTFIIIIAGFAMFRILTAPGGGGLEMVLLRIPALLIAITFHEFAHAYAAYKLGDNTPKDQGRVTLNPLKHLDPIGTVLILAAGFGWGRPVQINSRNFNDKISMSKGEAIVSFAGPLTNFILGFLFIIAIYVMHMTEAFSAAGQWGTTLLLIMSSCVFVNIGLGVFNLIPLPPLDGSKIMMHFLPYNAKNWFYRNEQIIMMVFLFAWLLGFLGEIVVPIIMLVVYWMEWAVANMLHLFM
ncbi:MAG: site-2 protease family protein [Oscillospiraceae bacterium]|nr:site-2 protease family protein [Oscillospiraceae bacterium]